MKNENQGKRKDQVEFSNGMAFYALLFLAVIVFSLIAESVINNLIK